MRTLGNSLSSNSSNISRNGKIKNPKDNNSRMSQEVKMLMGSHSSRNKVKFRIMNIIMMCLVDNLSILGI